MSFVYRVREKQFKIEYIFFIEKEMIICKFNDCKKQANFGVKNGKVEYCETHKKKNYINLHANICKYNECNKQPHFGIKGGKREYCDTHKPNNYISSLG